MPDNNRNDRYNVNDAVDTESFIRFMNNFRSMASDVDRQINRMFDSVDRRTTRSFDNINDTLDSFESEMSKLDRYLSRMNNRVSNNGSISGMISNGLNSGINRRIESNNESTSNLVREVRTGNRTFDQVKDRITKNTLENARLTRVTEFNTSAINSVSNVIKTYASKFISAFTGGADRYYNAYQQTFKSIAGRMGTDYLGTRSTYSDMLGLSYGSNKIALNIVDDLVPMLERSGRAGFTGDQAVKKAYSDALDSIIMPWLETNSDGYNNLFVNLTELQMEQLKNSQLQLQTSRSGNRLLQSGVIDSLTNELAPLLSNIDLNTGGAMNLSNQYKAIMTQLVDNGMSTQDAYAQVQTMIKNDKNLYDALSSGSIADVMYAANRVRGMDAIGSYSRMTGDINSLARSTGSEVGVGAVVSAMGYQTAGGFAMNYNMNSINPLEAYAAVNDMQNNNSYKDLARNASDRLTATQKVFNWLENTGTKLFGEIITALPFGDTFYDSVVNGIGTIIAILGSMAVSSIFSGSGGLGGLIRGSGGSGGAGGLGGLIRNALRGSSGTAGAGRAVIANATRTAGVLGGATLIGSSVYDTTRRGETSGTASTAATFVEAASGGAAIAAFVAGTGGVGAALLALGAAAKYTSDKLDETSAVVGEVKDAYKEQIRQANGLIEKWQLWQKQKEDEREAQAAYKLDRQELLNQIASLEASGQNDKVAEILKAAGASSVGIENYTSGRSSATDILTSRWWERLLGKKDLIQGMSTDQWNTVKGSYAVGLPYAYNDETVRIHRGERILTAAENAAYSAGLNSDEIVSAINAAVVELVAAIRELRTYNNVDYNNRTLARPRVEYDDNAINLRPQIGQLSGAF